MHSSRIYFNVLTAVLTSVLTAACAVGPDFERPAKPNLASYDSDGLPAQTDASDDASGASQKFAENQDIPAEWWELFHSEPLNQTIAQALKSNPDLAAQQAALRAASEAVDAADGALFPTLSGDFGTSRQKTAGAAYGGSFPGSVYTLHNATVSVAYGLDVFGGVRREIEELEAQQEYQRFQMEAAQLSLTANVVTAAVQEASTCAQLDATKKILEHEIEQRDLLQKQVDLGGISKTALLAQEATVAQFQATLPPLEKRLAITRHQLSVLEGQFPSNAPNATFDLASLHLPETLPLTFPSQLVEQRPDIRAAEANLHAASAAIGVAVANRLPQIVLSADMGTEANNLGKLFSPGTGIWRMAFDGSQTIFDFGTLAHEQGEAEAEFDVAAAQYRKTVLSAFQDVADTLRALQSDATTLNAQVAAEHAASESLKLSEDQFHAGSISYIALIDAERTEEQAKLALVQVEAARYADTAALFQALGGGWWNRKSTTAASDVASPSADAVQPNSNPIGSP